MVFTVMVRSEAGDVPCWAGDALLLLCRVASTPATALTGRCSVDLLAFKTSAMIDSKLSSPAAAVLLLLLPAADTRRVHDPMVLSCRNLALIWKDDRSAHRACPVRVAVASVRLPQCVCEPAACIELCAILKEFKH